MRMKGLNNVITEPTRISDTRQSLLDPILVTDNCDVIDSYVIQVDRQYSDHEATIIFLKIPYNFHKAYKRLVWDYKHADFDKCNELISSFDWESILSSENSMDVNCKNFNDKF